MKIFGIFREISRSKQPWPYKNQWSGSAVDLCFVGKALDGNGKIDGEMNGMIGLDYRGKSKQNKKLRGKIGRKGRGKWPKEMANIWRIAGNREREGSRDGQNRKIKNDRR